MQMKKFPIMFYIIFNSYYKPEVLDVNNELNLTNISKVLRTVECLCLAKDRNVYSQAHRSFLLQKY